MKKLPKLLFATVLTAAAILSMPHKTSAAGVDWCARCLAMDDCYTCCRCDGGGGGHCAFICS